LARGRCQAPARVHESGSEMLMAPRKTRKTGDGRQGTPGKQGTGKQGTKTGDAIPNSRPPSSSVRASSPAAIGQRCFPAARRSPPCRAADRPARAGEGRARAPPARPLGPGTSTRAVRPTSRHCRPSGMASRAEYGVPGIPEFRRRPGAARTSNRARGRFAPPRPDRSLALAVGSEVRLAATPPGRRCLLEVL
jgi:hypothetical protein